MRGSVTYNEAPEKQESCRVLLGASHLDPVQLTIKQHAPAYRIPEATYAARHSPQVSIHRDLRR
jgi:hypothetical protein